MGPKMLDLLFNPSSVAVFGASPSGESVGARVFANMVAAKFAGDVWPINPKHKSVAGHACFADLNALAKPVDLAVIATPAATVPGIITQCGEHGVAHAIVLSAGFGEGGSGSDRLEMQLAEAARRAGVRFMGPNCVGLMRPWLGLNATFLKTAAPKGRLALVSQSGALCSAICDWAGPHHLGFSTLASLGNATDIDFGEVLTFLSTDPKTDAILLYAEGVRDARSFLSALRAAAAVKPVIVLKAGRHNRSSQAAHTHTGALIGSDAVFEAALERAGAVRADTFGQLFAAAEILSAGARARGRRLAIVTNGGGAGVLAADRAGDLHLELPDPAPETLATLDKVLPAFWSHANPLDILGDAPPDHYGAAVKACLADDNFDGVLVMLTPQAMTDALSAAQAIVDVLPARRTKPVLACWMGETSVAEARKLLSTNRIPDFTTPEAAVGAFAHLARHDLNRKMALEVPGPLSDTRAPDLQGARLIVQGALAAGRSMLSDIESKAVLKAFRIPVNVTLDADTPSQALVAAQTVGFPIAMKILSPQITHKSDIGGVRTGIATAAQVQPAFREITEKARAARPQAEILGVTVEAMVRSDDAHELVIGASRDPVFGPTILFGAGGTMVEILHDSAVSLPPLNAVLARRLIERTRVSHLLDAFRDRPAADREAVIEVLLRVSDMVCELPEIVELDINPLLAGPDGVIAVDARIHIERPPAALAPYEHIAIAPYPRHLIEQDLLPNGTPLTIRPIRPEDAESEQDFVRALSPEARKMRFMYALRELTPAMLARFTQIDYSREMALIAEIDEGGTKRQRGVARYAVNPDGRSCEFAIVVSDEVRHQGVGTRLMKALITAARAHGLAVMEGSVLAVNQPMLQLMEELGFTRRPDPQDRDVVHVEREL